VPGSDLDGVLTLRTVGDADLIRAAATEAGRCAVVGGGFIGVEVAASLRALGVEVDLLMIEEHVLEGPLGRALGERLTALLRDRGVRVHPRAEVTAFHGESELVSVAARGAPAIQVPVAVVGAGIAPATELAEAAGLQTDLGGVACDQSFRTSAPDVFAAGDVAAVWSPLAGRRLRVEHWAEALNQGKLAARGMLDMAAAYDRVPYFFSDVFDSSIEYVGFGGPVEDEIAVERDGGLMAYHLSGDRLTGVAKLDVDDDLQGARELLRAGATRAEVEAEAGRS
jgi:3-phenylpropionate/trans-cinnamate dioxygenase ferredoxin reductase subunit